MNVEGPKHKVVVCLSAIVLFLIVGIWPPATRCLSLLPAPAAGTHGPYTTTFSRAESPISEGGKWLNGQTDGLDWTDVRTTPGFAFGTEIGGNRPDPQKYDDSTALLKGAWGPNQTVQATVRSVNPNQDGKVWEEVELRLKDRRLPEPGAVLVRDFKGKRISVTVLEHGFEYDGRVFKSLSAVAQHATGTIWNGYAFFRRSLSS